MVAGVCHFRLCARPSGQPEVRGGRQGRSNRLDVLRCVVHANDQRAVRKMDREPRQVCRRRGRRLLHLLSQNLITGKQV